MSHGIGCLMCDYEGMIDIPVFGKIDCPNCQPTIQFYVKGLPMFTPQDWDKLVTAQIDKIQSLAKLKGGEYSGDDDRLANFRRNAADCGVSMDTCWRVYAGKHWDAISQFIKDQNTGKTRDRLESIAGRVDDLIVYLLLYKAILQERGIG